MRRISSSQRRRSPCSRWRDATSIPERPKAAKVECNCAAPVAAAPAASPPVTLADNAPVASRHHRHRHGTARRYAHGYAWRRIYAETSVSRMIITVGARSPMTAATAIMTGYRTADAGWVDGYGRGPCDMARSGKRGRHTLAHEALSRLRCGLPRPRTAALTARFLREIREPREAVVRIEDRSCWSRHGGASRPEPPRGRWARSHFSSHLRVVGR